jgi:hypothetical protein
MEMRQPQWVLQFPAELNPARIWDYPKKKGVYGPEGREVVGGGV